jgi:AcrR family transcriptional regulator
MPEVKLDAKLDAKPGEVRPPRTQQQRREETRRALLDAAVESLIEVGFARTTTLEVQRRAEVSRGALLHHFPSKAELLVATVDHLAEMRARELKAFASQLPPEAAEGPGHTLELPGATGAPGAPGEPGEPGEQAQPAPGSDARTGAVLGLLWQCFSGTFFQVAMELRTAARTDPELRQVLTVAERSLRDRIVAQSRTLFGKAVAEHPGLERAIDLTLQLMIGAAMTGVLHGDSSRLDDLIEDWKALFSQVLARASGAAVTEHAEQLPEHKTVKGKR